MDYKHLKKYSDLNNLNDKKQIVGLLIKGRNYVASTHIRLLSAFNNFNDEFFEFYIIDDLEITNFKKDLNNDRLLLDILIVQRDAVNLEFSKLLVNKCNLFGIKLIYEIDDDLVNIDENHNDFEFYKEKIKAIKFLSINSSCITVTTTNLKKAMLALNKNIEIIPNALIDLWDIKNEMVQVNDTIKIGYMGTTTHSDDLKLIKKAIENIQSKFSTKIIFEMIGGINENWDNVHRIDVPPNKEHYPEFVKWIQQNVEWDIALAPLIGNNNINESKSELKYLEYTALGVPGIYSDVGSYSESIVDGKNGLLVFDNSSEEWENKIEMLIKNKKIRKQIIKNAIFDVTKNYTLDNLIKNWKYVLNKYKRNKKSILYLKIKEFINIPEFKRFNDFLISESENILIESGLFDEEYYLLENPQVNKYNVPPIKYFLEFDSSKKTNPNANFDSNQYYLTHPYVEIFNLNPFIYYILYDNLLFDESLIIKFDSKKNNDVLKKSKLFDSDLYLKLNPDVKKANVDPYTHYINHGYNEPYRKVNSTFSNLFYKNNYLNNCNVWNPLTHYILIGEKRKFKQNCWDFPEINFSKNVISDITENLNKKTSIVVPIFNYSEKIIDSINSLINNTLNFKLLIFINKNIFDKYEEYFNDISNSCVLFINKLEEHEINYNIKNCIKSSSDDIVIFNSYCLVPKDWLSSLIIKAYSNKCDSISPLSNNFLDVCPCDKNVYEDNYNLTIDGISTILKKSFNNEKIYSNFADPLCIYIKNNSLAKFQFNDEYAVYDRVANRYLLKIPNNINHMIDSSCYVYHDPEFFLYNQQIFDNYENNFIFFREMKKFLNSDVLNKIKKNFDIAFNSKKDITLSNRILFILDEDKIHQTYELFMHYINKHYDCYFLSSSENYFKLWKNNEIIKKWKICSEVLSSKFKNDFFKEIYYNVLFNLNVDILHIENLAYNSFELIEISKKLHIPIVCNIEECIYNIEKNFLKIQNKNKKFKYDFSYYVDEFSKILAQTINFSSVNFPKKDSSPIYLNENSLNIINKPCFNERLLNLHSNDDTPIKLFIPGNLSENMFKIIKKIYLHDEKNLFEFHFFGNLPKSLGNNFYYHGKYEYNDLNNKILEISPKFILLMESNEIFDIIKECECTKTPVILDENLIDLAKEYGLNYMNFEKTNTAYDNLVKLSELNNYYFMLKRLYCQDEQFKKEIIIYNQELENIYFEIGNKNPKLGLKKTNLNQPNKNINFNDFEGFLANSYVNPLIYAPFVEEDKRCFALMDNISKYLMSKVPKHCDILVSIIMPVFNRVNIVKNAIDSVLNQSYENFELIIIDDCSTDGTQNLLKTIDDERVKLIFCESNRGSSVARNIGLMSSNGDYITYLDSDNEWDSRYLESTVGAFIELPDADALYSGQLLYEHYDEPPIAMRFGSLNKSLLKNGNYIDLNCFAHKRNVFKQIGGFDESLYRLIDWDFILRICNNFKVYSVPFLLSKYYLSITDNNISDITSKSNERILEYKNYNRLIQYKNELKPKKVSPLKKKVSIIIPSFESIMDLQNCINAILDLNNELVEIIVVDNNSNKFVRDYLEYLGRNEKISLIQNEINYGFTYAVNQGIAISDINSDILLLNNDAILTDYALESLQNFAYEHDDCGLVVPQQVLPGRTPSINIHVPYATAAFECDVTPSAHHKNIINMPIFHDGETLELNFAPFFCVYIKREILEKSMGLDAELGRHYRSDRIFSDYVRDVLNLKIFHISNAIVYHKLQRSTNILRKDKDDFEQMFVKNQWEPELLEQLNFKKPLWDK